LTSWLVSEIRAVDGYGGTKARHGGRAFFFQRLGFVFMGSGFAGLHAVHCIAFSAAA
jgi:hypothetical protein